MLDSLDLLERQVSKGAYSAEGSPLSLSLLFLPEPVLLGAGLARQQPSCALEML